MEALINYLTLQPDDLDFLDLSYQNLNTLPDISRFKKLERLFINGNNLTKLPNYLADLTHLWEIRCEKNKITHIERLPKNIQYLNCSDNRLRRIPEPIPLTLHTLICQNNPLYELPSSAMDWYLGISCHNTRECLYPFQEQELRNNLWVIEKINKFRYFYYLQKYSGRIFRRIILTRRMNRIRNSLLETSAKITMHPNRIQRLLASGELDTDNETFQQLF